MMASNLIDGEASYHWNRGEAMEKDGRNCYKNIWHRDQCETRCCLCCELYSKKLICRQKKRISPASLKGSKLFC